MAQSPKKKITLNPELEVLQAQVNELTAALLRERADATNVRRRAEEDRLKMASFFKAAVIKELLPFIDNFDRALSHAPKTEDKAQADWLQGLAGVYKQLQQALDALGVKRIKTVGEAFDPRYHEAVQLDQGSEGGQEVVIEEFAPGYIIDDEVLRHAMVKVAMK